ncbi:MAG: hypothetical protein JW984_05650 [Deltaproteobacteria bacterium]|uniref:Uncharacterized protein n=1 Tax=Candidatus Zymogenus saltonus TaxID=2844893 RepID=A0A9D8KEK8_9DELT|nr:hypothetical protein [Candidatus Zymogenus saltonus]
MFAKVKFTDGETRTYAKVWRIKIVGDFIVIRRMGRRSVTVPGREIRWVQLGKEKRIDQKDFVKGVTL